MCYYYLRSPSNKQSICLACRAKDGKRKKQYQLVGPAYPYAKQRVKVLQAICWYVLRDRASFALLVASQIASRSKVVVARKVFTGRFTCYAQAAIVGKKRERKGFALILW